MLHLLRLPPRLPPFVLTFTPGPLVTVGEFGTNIDAPTLEAFFVRFLAALVMEESIPETPELAVVDIVVDVEAFISINSL